MATTINVPVGASLEARADYRIGFHPQLIGGRLSFRLYRGMASDGYKSDYSARLAYWLVGEGFNAEGKRLHKMCFRMGGKNAAKAPAQFIAWCTDTETRGCTKIVP